MEELWKKIEGFDGYIVSNTGIVKSLPRMRKSRGNSFAPVKERILAKKIDKSGYHTVGLCKDGKVYWRTIHRLVAKAFIPNPNNLPQVNHKNEIKTDNRVENLEWCTNQYNIEYSFSKPILQYDLQGNLIREWVSAAKIEQELGICHSDIAKCCSMKPHHHTQGGYVWRYKEKAA